MPGMEAGESIQSPSSVSGALRRKQLAGIGRKRGRTVEVPEPVIQRDDYDPLNEFNCVICLQPFSEPEVTKCGHTFCKSCIRTHVEAYAHAQCPLCKTSLVQEELVPNFQLDEIITFIKKPKKISRRVLSGADAKDAWLSSLNSVNDLEVALALLRRKKEALLLNSDLTRKNLTKAFLEDLRKIKVAEKERLEKELSLINQDLARTEYTVPKIGSGTEAPAWIPPSSSGFNTQLLSYNQASLATKKSRVSNHLNELSEIYLLTRSSHLYDTDFSEDAVPSTSDAITTSYYDGLDEFEETLNQVSSYQGLKPLATINYSGEILTASNIASSVEFDKNGEFFSVAGTSGKIRLFEYEAVIASSIEYQRSSSEIVCKSKVSSVAWSSYYGNQMATSDYEGCVAIWDVGSLTAIKNFSEHQKRVWSVDWCPLDPRLLASGSDDEKIRLWSTNTDRSIATIEATGNICTVKFAPDSYTLACGGTDKNIYLYDIRQARSPLNVLKGHSKSVSHVKFLNKTELASASTDSHLKLWNVADSTLIRTFQGHVNDKNFVGLATDGNFLACGSEDNSLYVYSKVLANPLFSFKFDAHLSMFGHAKPENSSTEFVSTVGWKKNSPIIVGANSQGAIKILQLV